MLTLEKGTWNIKRTIQKQAGKQVLRNRKNNYKKKKRTVKIKIMRQKKSLKSIHT